MQIGETKIDTTTNHPFWVVGYGFKEAGDLGAGEKVLTAAGEIKTITSVEVEELETPVTVDNFEVKDWHTYYVSELEVLVHNSCGVESGRGSVKNWKGQEVKIPDGHIMSSRDPSFSAKPITEAGPYTSAQRDAFLSGNSARTKLAPHHRHQIPVRDGGVIDELSGPGHPSGNQHTAGSPSRHPAKSIFNSESGGNVLRADEIKQHWIDKGNRLIEVEPGCDSFFA